MQSIPFYDKIIPFPIDCALNNSVSAFSNSCSRVSPLYSTKAPHTLSEVLFKFKLYFPVSCFTLSTINFAMSTSTHYNNELIIFISSYHIYFSCNRTQYMCKVLKYFITLIYTKTHIELLKIININ